MSEYPSLPLFTDAYLADTRHLTAQEHGAYLLLLMMAWRTTDCRLPDDDAKLAKWACVDSRTWRRIKPTVMDFWTPESGTWVQKRLAKEREYVSKRAEVARENGKHGGRPKPLNSNGSENPAGSSWVPQPKAPNPILTTNLKTRESGHLLDRLLEALGCDGNPPMWAATSIGHITNLIAAGYNLETDILPVIRAKRRSGIQSWKYFIPAVEQAVRDRKAIAPKPEPEAIDWVSRLKAYEQDKTWGNWGPRPGEPGCKVPRELLTRAA